jgi:hypothetical protein
MKSMDVISYLIDVASKVLSGQRLSETERIASAFLSLTVAAAVIPLAIEAGMATYSYGKSKGWWK